MSNSKVKKEYEYRSLIPTGDLVDSGTGEVVNVDNQQISVKIETGDILLAEHRGTFSTRKVRPLACSIFIARNSESSNSASFGVKRS